MRVTYLATQLGFREGPGWQIPHLKFDDLCIAFRIRVSLSSRYTFYMTYVNIEISFINWHVYSWSKWTYVARLLTYVMSRISIRFALHFYARSEWCLEFLIVFSFDLMSLIVALPYISFPTNIRQHLNFKLYFAIIWRIKS